MGQGKHFTDDITDIVIYTRAKGEKYIIKMMDIDQESASYQISQISRDSQLLSLFNKCQSNEEIKQEKPEACELSDVKPDTNYNFRGYWSDQQTSKVKNKHIRKQKQITNRKEKQQEKKRTKVYIQMLQNRVSELQDENEKLRKLNKINKEYIHRLNQSEHNINGYFVGKQQVFEKLEKLNSEPQTSNDKILEEITSLRLRQGSFGKDRIKSVNYYFKEMVEMLLPEIQKYIVKIALEQSDFFQASYLETGRHRNELEGWRKKLLESIQQDSHTGKLREFIKLNQRKMIEASDKLKEMLENFYDMKCRLMEHAKKMEQIIDGFHKFMTPRQVSKIVCYIDRYRFEKNILLQQTFKSLFEKMSAQSYCYDTNDVFGLSKLK